MKKTIPALLILSMIIAAFASCSQDTGDTGETTVNDTAVETTSAETTTSKPKADVPEKDYEGYAFRMIVRDAGTLDSRLYENFDRAEENGEVLNDAFYFRNRNIEEELNIEISQIPNDVPGTASQNAVLSGDDTHDALLTLNPQLYTMAAQGSLVNFYDIPYISNEADWWDQQLRNAFTINDKLFYHTGEITLLDDTGVVVSIFNKDMWEEHSLDDPYALVKDGKWTLDKMAEFTSGVNTDLDGDGQMGENDAWGLVSEIAGANNLFFGSGEYMVKNNNGSSIDITFGNERAVSVVEDVLALLNNGEVLIGDKLTRSDKWPYISTMFQENRILMRTTTFEPVPRDLRKMDADFGVLPIPKYDEAQDGYHSQANYNVTCVGVPAIASDLERTGIILESLAVESLSTVTPAFYEVSLQGKVLRDDSSQDMLDIIFSSKVYDAGLMFNIAGFSTLLPNMVTAGTNIFASSLASIMSTAETQIAAVMEIFE